MENEKFSQILNGTPQKMSSQQIMEFGVYCSGQSLPLEKFISIARTLYEANRESCYEFLKFVEKHEINRNCYKDFHHQPAKIQIYNCLMALTLSKALRENVKEAADGFINQAIKYMNLSIDVKKSAEKTVILLRGFMTYYKGDFNNAINILVKSCQEATSAQGETGMSTISLIGLAEINFMKKNYTKALQYYKKALISNKNLPSKARLGMGLCFFQLQKYQLADLCFRRIIKLDPHCIDAYVGLAVVRCKDGDYGGYFANIKIAFELDPNNPLVLLHLAEHFFLSSQKQKAKDMCLKGLKALEKSPKFLKSDTILRNDYAQFKARFNNIIAQVHHSNHEFEQALKYYTVVRGKGFLHNEVGLAQCYIQANMLKEALQILENLCVKSNSKQLKLVSEMFKTVGYLQVKMQAKPVSENGPNFYYKEALKYNPHDYETHIDYSVYLAEQSKEKTLHILLKALDITKQKGNILTPQLLNNIGVFQIENKEYDCAVSTLKKSKLLLQETNTNKQHYEGEEKIKYQALYLTVNFNYALALQKLNLLGDAIATHQKLVDYNKYYIDSYVKIAQLLHGLGHTHEAFEILDKAIDVCGSVKLNSMRIDKLVCMKGHLQHVDGGNLDAKETMKKLGKNKYQYGTFYDICLGYETVIKKQYEPAMVKDFIRPNREYLIGVCSNDHHNFYSYMLLTVMLITDKKISREQGAMYFNQLKVAELEFPQVLFNLGLYQIINGEYDGALFSFSRFRQKSRSHKANEYIALTHYLKENYDECIRAIKMNIALEPNNVRYRFQLACALQRRLYKKFEEGKNVKEMSRSYQAAASALRMYEQFTKMNPGDYMRGVDNPNLKDYLRNEVGRIRSICEQRLRILSSALKHYKKLELDMIEKDRIKRDQEAKKLEELQKAKQKKFLMDQLMDDQEQDERQKEKEKQRKQALIERARNAMAQAERQWETLKENNELMKENKKKRNTNPQSKKPKKQRKNQKAEEKQEGQYPSQEQQFRDDYKSQQDEYEDDPDIEKAKKHKKKDDRQRKKKKKKEKERRRERQNSGEDVSRGNYSSDGVKDEQEGLSEVYEKRKRSRSLSGEDEPRKKKKKNEDEDDDLGLDLDKYMI